MRRLALAFLTLLALAGPLAAQSLQASPPFTSPSYVCPTAPPGDSSNRCASTAFVQGVVGSPVLTQNHLFIGDASNLAADVAMSGDCTIASTGVIICTKTNNVAFAASATTDTTNAANITSGILPPGRVTGTGTLTAGASGAGFTLNFGTSTLSGTIPIANGGLAGSTVPANGRIPIGNATGYTVANLTAGANITITNGAGTIQIDAASASSTPCTTTALSLQRNNAGALGCVSGATADATSITITSGNFKLAGSGSGTSVLNAPATGGGTNTLPPGTDILAGLTATQTFTGKTIQSTANTLDSRQLVGTLTNDSANAGNMGEFLSQDRTSAGPLALANTITANLTASPLVLTAGDWDVWGVVIYTGDPTTTVYQTISSISAVSATLDQTNGRFFQKAEYINTTFSYSQYNTAPIGPFRITTTGTTLYLTVYAQFGVSTMSAFGSIYARRRR